MSFLILYNIFNYKFQFFKFFINILTYFTLRYKYNIRLFMILRTRNVPWHILAPAAVAGDICIVCRSAHPCRAFLCNRNEVSYYTKNKSVNIVDIHRPV